MNITIVTIGKIKKNFIKAGIKEYSKRLGRYCKVKHLTIKKIEEWKRKVDEKKYIIVVHSKGDTLSSQGLAHCFKGLGIEGKSDIVLFAAPEVLPEIKADLHLSLSSMDMDYELMILTLYEQIYRAFTIIHNLPYHK